MTNKISKLPSPALAGVVKSKSVKGAIAEIANCTYGGASMIDLHLSCLENRDKESLEAVIGYSRLPVLALNYNADYDGVPAGFSEEERVQLFLRAVEAGAAGIDMQGYTLDIKSKDGFFGEDKYSFTKGNPKEIVTDKTVIAKQCEVIEQVHTMGAEVLLSCHPGIAMSCEQIVDLALFLEKRCPDVIKIVTIAESEDDLIESFKTMLALKREVKTPVSYHTAGKAGRLSRVVNPILGGHIAFCVEHYNEGSLIEQPELQSVKAIIENANKII
ncbi:MAG: type I 3-dehydroquinate dehydratase [Clostridia bacterium]|nr:type I 3-dehydroquinate dehydratase [Clostridia bacterium]